MCRQSDGMYFDMHDSAIEEYIRIQTTSVYPDVEAAQIYVKFPSAVFGVSRSRRGDSIGSEKLSVLVIIVNTTKLDRKLFIEKFPRKNITVDSVVMEQNFINTEQQDYIEIIKNKGLIFTLQFNYDI